MRKHRKKEDNSATFGTRQKANEAEADGRTTFLE